MYKELFDALTTKFEGVSAAVISRIAHKLEGTVTTEEEVKTAVEGVTIQQVIDGEADRRATDAQKTAVANYEKKHGLKQGKPISGENNEGNNGSTTKPQENSNGEGGEVPAYVKQLLESNKQLSERLGRMEQERTTSGRKEQLKQAIANLPATLRKPYERADVSSLSEEDFNTYIADVQKDVKEMKDTLDRQGVVFGQPSAGGYGQRNEELTKEQIEAINHRAGVTKEGEQPF